MESDKIFVLILTVFVVGILAYFELKSRRARKLDKE